ncbi:MULTISPECIES: threonine dehydratase [Nostocales]|uniref:Threonine dehydratase n=3 Tax=Nostocales TaxID=1161 RepID=A0A0C1RK39_9CYAN|nr:threonine dehydratase [Tolypothrix bouteillei]KAF3890314.1 threonine dehydratase [Tolypothrix bouteillei VB521301]
MSRLIQIFQNTFIRFEAFFGFLLRSLLNFFSSIKNFFARLFGFSNSQYFLEPDTAQGIKRSTSEQSKIEESKPAQINETQTKIRPRRPNPQMDYFLNMARDVKKS